MAMPPHQTKDPFDLFVQELAPTYEEFGVILDFTRCNELMDIYRGLTPFDGERSEYLTHNFISCQDTLIGYLAIAQKLMLDAQTTEREVEAEISVKEDVRSVANGERLANKHERVVAARRDSNLLISFHEGLRMKLDNLKQAHYACKQAWEIAEDAKKRRPMSHHRG